MDTVTVDDARALARVAGLPLDPSRADLLAQALETDLRAIRRLRGLDVGETWPAGLAASGEPAHGR